MSAITISLIGLPLAADEACDDELLPDVVLPPPPLLPLEKANSVRAPAQTSATVT